MTTQDEVIDFAKGSTRSAGKCLGFANNDVVGHFGKLGELPYSAKTAADQLAQHGQLNTSACPDYPHVDFYDYVTGGVNLGHVDWHFPQRGIHVADSGRTNVKLNKSGTVGTYPSWGGTRRGWAAVPALGAQINIVNDPVQQPSSGGSLEGIAREVIAGKWGNGPARVQALTRAGYDASAVQAEVNALLNASSPQHRTYTVQRGDSLSGIANRLRINGGWRTLWSINRGVIGPNPNVIRAGMVLTLP